MKPNPNAVTALKEAVAHADATGEPVNQAVAHALGIPKEAAAFAAGRAGLMRRYTLEECHQIVAAVEADMADGMRFQDAVAKQGVAFGTYHGLKNRARGHNPRKKQQPLNLSRHLKPQLPALHTIELRQPPRPPSSEAAPTIPMSELTVALVLLKEVVTKLETILKGAR